MNNYIENYDEYEASVIGGLLISGLSQDASDVLATLEPDVFYSRFYREMFRIIRSQAKTRGMIDSLMVADAMGDEHWASVMQIAKNCPSAANLKGYANMVAANHERRRMIELMDQTRALILSSTIENAAESMDAFLAQAMEIRRPRDEIRPLHVSELLDDYSELLEKRLKNGEQSDTLKTGIEELDEITGGINPVDLVIVAARPGMGKTEFALKISSGVASQTITGTDQKRGVLVFSMEMDSQQIIERQLAGASNLPISVLRNPARLDDEGWDWVTVGLGKLQQLDIWVVDASKLTVEQIMSIARRHKKAHPALSLIMVDYLGLIDKPKAERNDLAIAHISSSLKRLAKDLKTPVMSLSQLSRDVEKRPNKRPVNADLRDSGSVEQDADSIIMLYRDAVYNENSPAAPYAEIIVTKNRFGQLGTVYQRFRNGHFMPTDQEEAARVCQNDNKPHKRFAKGANV
ncbi:replicative DNA helicase [Xenorhabdus griffiniae]|uniref:DNA 5'-3' helicase n=1 Tax=Xenorhabdus griffiniae TaxID=351672 RepID=A0ABY9XEI1_9GAMM|nr:replicative DNA helicase [Xenorhabdus griffiniae]MBD1229115.1 AAA family ATPase [Xenorhabdus griffiniae]MBE8588827.1 AAA family ATPase [Xenorhabdus griffiniae]WMV71261.1 replicative DNA helicase [Xenorhabdus griffiniae]WNH00937.1 replicative DNA helicase [Xenorhabdus griffiniae]